MLYGLDNVLRVKGVTAESARPLLFRFPEILENLPAPLAEIFVRTIDRVYNFWIVTPPPVSSDSKASSLPFRVVPVPGAHDGMGHLMVNDFHDRKFLVQFHKFFT